MTATFKNTSKAGGGWSYDENDFDYTESTSPTTNEPIYYDTVGTPISWSNQTKS